MGPSSTTSVPSGAMKRPSEAPPLVERLEEVPLHGRHARLHRREQTAGRRTPHRFQGEDPYA